MSTVSAQPRLDLRLLEEAADLLVRLQSDENPQAVQTAIAEWQKRSEAHVQAWRCAEVVQQSFNAVPGTIGRRTLNGLKSADRRRVLRSLVGIAVAGPLGLALWHERSVWTADISTATGEQKTMTLADGTRLVMNTATSVDIRFSEHLRHLRLLRGEVMLTSGRDPLQRPFHISTAEGRITPVGTRYSVRQDSGRTQVAVFEGRVEISTENGARHSLPSGEQAIFDSHGIAETRLLRAGADSWQHGMLLAQDMRLGDWVREMGRYRHGVLRCAPAVAELRVSGAYPLTDIDNALDMLAKTRPVYVRRLTNYWISLEPSAAA